MLGAAKKQGPVKYPENEPAGAFEPVFSETHRFKDAHGEDGGGQSFRETQDEEVWYVAIADQQIGPVSVRDLGDHWDRGEVDEASLIWKAPLSKWLPMREVMDLRHFIASKSGGGAPSGEPLDADQSLRLHVSTLEATAALNDPDRSGDMEPPVAEMSDPFAAIAAEDSDMGPEGTARGAWRRHGITEIYQAMSLADAWAVQPLAAAPPEEPFQQHDSSASTDEIDIAHVARQSSVVLQRPSFVEAPQREYNWLLIGGIAAAAIAFFGLLTFVVVLVARGPS